jgi:peptide/nickel transport system permease protein
MRLVLGLAVAIWYLVAGIWLWDDGRARHALRGDVDHMLEAPAWWPRTFLGTNHTGQKMSTLFALAPGMYARELVRYLVIAVGLMVLAGIASGYGRGWPSAVVRRIVEANHALPQLILVFAALSFAGVSFGTLSVALAITSGLAKSLVIRDRVLDLRTHDFFEGLREMGVPTRSVIGRHILFAHCRPLVLVQIPFLIAELVFFESCVGYLGRPVDVTGVSYGGMLHGALQQWGLGAHWLFWVPAVGVVVSILGWSWLGQALAERYMPEGTTV